MAKEYLRGRRSSENGIGAGRTPKKAIGTYYCPLRFQSATIPFRFVEHDIEILLVTRKKGKGWTVPKGLIEYPLSPCQSAEEEAWEEAGIRGFVCPQPLGEYRYQKWGGMCHVRVFVMRADSLADTWPEDRMRERKWFPVSDAVSVVGKRGLRTVLVDAVPKIRRLFSSARITGPGRDPERGGR